MDFDQLVHVFLSVLGEKILFSVWAAKYFPEKYPHELNYGLSERDGSYLISFSYHTSSL